MGGKLYLALEGYKAIGRFDPAQHTMDWTIGLGQKGPHMLAVSADGNTVIGTNPESNTVSIVTNLLKSPISVEVAQVSGGNEPEGIELSPDGKEVWVSDQQAGGFSVIDLGKKAVTQHVDLKTTHATRLRLTPDGRRLLLVDRHTAELVVVDAATRAVVKKIMLPDSMTMTARNRNRIYDVAVTPDSARAFVSVNSSPGRSYIGIVDLKALALTGRIETGATADGMAWVASK
jgi:DNA-binding beta-propeller fold protein YncE